MNMMEKVSEKIVRIVLNENQLIKKLIVFFPI